jgi:hypothetical protein
MIRLSPDPNVVYELKPDLSVLYQGARVATNAQGFRTDERTAELTCNPAEIVTCIVGVGDSFMFGQGVPARDAYMAVMAGRLDEREGPHVERRGGPVRFVNTAVPGYNTVMEIATLEAKGLAYEPRVVIVEFVGNDLSLPNFVREPRRPWSLRRSFLGDFAKARLGGGGDRSLYRRLLDAGLLGVPQEDTAAMGSTTDPALVPPAYRGLVGWDAYAAAMQRLQELSALHGFDVVSISLGAGDGELETRALRLSRALGFHVIDIGDAFADYLQTNGHADFMRSPLALSPDDGHPSILAHRIAGEILADYLEASVLSSR